jgi:hypothetical protein
MIRAWPPCGEVQTILTLPDVGKLIRITEGVHEGCKACRVKVDRVIGEKCPNELLESQIPGATVSALVAIVVAMIRTRILIRNWLLIAHTVLRSRGFAVLPKFCKRPNPKVQN